MDIDSIDITDSAFSLAVPNIIGGSDSSTTIDYTMFIYIGVAVIILIIGMFIYKTYRGKNNNQIVEDCTGGFCNMNEQYNQPNQQNQYENQQNQYENQQNQYENQQNQYENQQNQYNQQI
jgi:hypothetical protein